MRQTLQHQYHLMREHFGLTHWWPGETPFEIATGAILTQNTNWYNVEKALNNLKSQNLLSPAAILNTPIEHMETLLRPSGYFRVKTHRLRQFSLYLMENHNGDMTRMAAMPLDILRPELLSIHGIGPETADDILLYACDKSVFVVDTYTRRILSRHGLVPATICYEALRSLYEDHVENDLELYKDYHGQIVYTGKDFCKSKPNCTGCPLEPTLKHGQPL